MFLQENSVSSLLPLQVGGGSLCRDGAMELTSSTADPATQAIGLPPYVLKWLAVAMVAAISDRRVPQIHKSITA